MLHGTLAEPSRQNPGQPLAFFYRQVSNKERKHPFVAFVFPEKKRGTSHYTGTKSPRRHATFMVDLRFVHDHARVTAIGFQNLPSPRIL